MNPNWTAEQAVEAYAQQLNLKLADVMEAPGSDFDEVFEISQNSMYISQYSWLPDLFLGRRDYRSSPKALELIDRYGLFEGEKTNTEVFGTPLRSSRGSLRGPSSGSLLQSISNSSLGVLVRYYF